MLRRICAIDVAPFSKNPGIRAGHLVTLIFSLLTFVSAAQAEDVVLRHSYAGNLSFSLTGNTMRRANNTCQSLNQSSAILNLPAGSTVEAAFLYWSGSGNTDSSVTLNNQTVNADVSYNDTFGGRVYYSSKADVTALIPSATSTNFTVRNLNFDGSNAYCSTGGAYGGWALSVVYENPAEPLRVVNVFDGFRNFWGQSFDLIPDNFVIAQNPASLGGKHAHITWEGDAGNSQARNGFTETLVFEGSELIDAGNPSANQFNGFSNVVGNTSGVDIDEYEIGNFLTAGDTSVVTRYSSGQDAVFLTAELISVPNEPVADIQLTQSGPANILAGQNSNITFSISNNGPNTATAGTLVNVPLPAGVTYQSFSGSNWNCIPIPSGAQCTYNQTIPDGGSAPDLILTLQTTTPGNSVTLTATATSAVFDNILTNNTASTVYPVVRPDLSTSQKTVTDINGGNVNPGDILRYAITLNETNGVDATNVTLNDHLPAGISSFSVSGIPAGVTETSQPAPAGNNGAGLINITGLDIPANGSVTITVDAILASGLAPDTQITNSAVLSSAAFSDITVTSGTAIISRPANPASGNKPLYFGNADQLTRVQPAANTTVTIAHNGSHTWNLTPAFQSAFELSSSSVDVFLFLQNDFNNGTWNHTVTATLLRNNVAIGNVQQQISVPSQGVNGNNVALYAFNINLNSTPVFSAGDSLSLRLNNVSGFPVDSLRVFSVDPNPVAGDAVSPRGLVSLPAATVINVDQIDVIRNSLSVIEGNPGDNLTVRATVSDPFGSFDITGAELTVTSPSGATLFSNQAMSLFSDDGQANRVFNHSFSLPSDAESGVWLFSVTADEGAENEISHTSQFSFTVNQPLPNITVSKSVETVSDPLNGTVNPKALPGAELVYSIRAINTGPGNALTDTVFISDQVPANTRLFVGDFSSGSPVAFTDGSISSPGTSLSSLTFSFSGLGSAGDDISFSDNNGSTFNYVPVPGADGYDPLVTHFRINPKGVFQAPASGTGQTEFTLQFRVKLN